MEILTTPSTKHSTNASIDKKLYNTMSGWNNNNMLTRVTPFRNKQSFKISQNDSLLLDKLSDVARTLYKKSTVSTTLYSPTPSYFDIRSEHFYRRKLNQYNEQMLKNEMPYKYIIVPVMNSRNETYEYKTAQETLECYAALHKYAYRVLYADGSDEESHKFCTQKDIMFRRHCVFAQFMKNNPNYKWFLFLDADIGVINPDKRLEDYTLDLPDRDLSDELADIIFYNRIFNFQVAAGSYLARNTNFSYNFLMEWSNYLNRFPGSFIGRDNGVLHLHLMEKYATKDALKKCLSLLEASLGYEEVTNFEACARHLFLGLGDTKNFRALNGRVMVLDKGKSWVRDGGEILTSSRWSDNDFMFHGWKKSKLFEIGDGRDAWIYPFSNKEFRMNLCNSTVKEALSNWTYKAYLKIHNNDIESMIEKIIGKVKESHYATIMRLNL